MAQAPAVVPPAPALAAPAAASCYRVLVVGANSYLGSSLALGLRDKVEVFGTFYKDYGRIDGVTMMQLDVLNAGAILDVLKRVEPDVVLYCAGPADNEETEQVGPEAESLLVKAPSLFFKIPVKPFHFIYFSSDQVFSGEGPFEEITATKPAQKFGQLKAQAEGLMRSQGRLTHVLRLGSLFGETAGGGARFRHGIFSSFVRAAEKGEALRLPKDRRRSFLYVGELVRAVKAFLEKLPEASSVYNLAPPDALSFHEFAETIARQMKWTALQVHSSSDADAVEYDTSLVSKPFSEKFAFEFARTRDAIAELAERLNRGHTRPWI